MPFFVGGLAAVAVLMGCAKKDKGPKAWPDRPLVQKKDTVRGIQFSISVPKGVGAFRDPNVIIYRHVDPSFAFFIKVMRETALPDPKAIQALKDELAQEPGKKLLRLEASKARVELIVQEAPNNRHRVQIWKKRGSQVLKCQAFLGRKIGGPAQVKKSNAWVLKICRSLEIVDP